MYKAAVKLGGYCSNWRTVLVMMTCFSDDDRLIDKLSSQNTRMIRFPFGPGMVSRHDHPFHPPGAEPPRDEDPIGLAHHTPRGSHRPCTPHPKCRGKRKDPCPPCLLRQLLNGANSFNHSKIGSKTGNNFRQI